ncbi:hypothetical protein BO86DRAFT_21589 [Aspergillus japonicus CBS 114.51]|uniref:Secreted protein n=1 Tax=Aspergillus japonicus CBS 114.51 TaxID=1448312 RepID=A0A8T8X6X6_ASPJA|nr:hypothetical protein BO86DRAFT_21589 [Aspergillus japonicus CBS 114.51]RAH83898.1 hypothetical protein BO86DRAFT_21589 [Aspergillus japonicus CBS 114.51]
MVFLVVHTVFRLSSVHSLSLRPVALSCGEEGSPIDLSHGCITPRLQLPGRGERRRRGKKKQITDTSKIIFEKPAHTIAPSKPIQIHVSSLTWWDCLPLDSLLQVSRFPCPCTDATTTNASWMKRTATHFLFSPRTQRVRSPESG